MQKRFVLLCLWAVFGAAQAETVKGRIAVVSQQAGTVQIEVKGKDKKTTTKVVVRTDANTRYAGASGLKDLGPPDLIEVEREPGRPAGRIKKIVFGLPPGVELRNRRIEDDGSIDFPDQRLDDHVIAARHLHQRLPPVRDLGAEHRETGPEEVIEQ